MDFFFIFCKAGVLYITKPKNARLAVLGNSLETRWRPRWPRKVLSTFKGYVLHSYVFQIAIKLTNLMGNE